jgi:hypothetical protein
MRRLIAISLLMFAVSAAAGCTSTSKSPAPVSKSDAGGSTAVSSTATCTKLRSVVADDIGPIGTAFGTIVGDATAKNTAGVQSAEADATTALNKLGTDLKAAADAGDSPTVKAAVTTSLNKLATLTSDPSFLSDISSMDDLAAATSKLQDATAPITTACQGS